MAATAAERQARVMLPVAAAILAALAVSALVLSVSRSLVLRDVAAAAICVVLPAIVAAILACGLVERAIS